MNTNDLKNPELQEKLKTCKTADELFELARDEGVELSDEQLDTIAGGEWSRPCDDHYCGVPFGR